MNYECTEREQQEMETSPSADDERKTNERESNSVWSFVDEKAAKFKPSKT